MDERIRAALPEEHAAPAGSVMFSSPCFFCPRLETCGEDEAINYRNCPKLDLFISK